MTTGMHTRADTASGVKDYRNQAAVPDHAKYMENWRTWSVAARISLPQHLDVAYGEHPLETCDIFSGSTKGAPVFVFIHGGWWHFLDKSDYSYVARPFVVRGAVCVCINYPLAPAASIGDIVASVQKAIAWIHRNIHRYGGDPDRISVGGHSAGGHLSSMMAFTEWTALGLPADVVKTNCSISGLYNLNPILETPHNDSIRMDKATAQTQGPIDRIMKTGTRHIVCVGGSETSGFLWQHQTFVLGCELAGLAVQDIVLDGEHHFGVVDRVADTDSVLFQTLWREMQK